MLTNNGPNKHLVKIVIRQKVNRQKSKSSEIGKQLVKI